MNILKYIRKIFVLFAFFFIMVGIYQEVLAADWSTTELHIQYGKLESPSFRGGSKLKTQIYTWQHVSGWKYGDNFFFVDFTIPENDGLDAYGEWYSNFSFNKITGMDISSGIFKDLGIIAGVNLGSDANVKIYLPGIRFSWQMPGFAFLNTDFTAYLVDNPGISAGGAPDENNSYMVDINWAYPFSIATSKFSIEGHMEYVGSRENEMNQDVSEWFLAQPQIRWNAGDLINMKDTFFIGIEYQYWMNKLGDKNTDENTIQALLVWRL